MNTFRKNLLTNAVLILVAMVLIGAVFTAYVRKAKSVRAEAANREAMARVERDDRVRAEGYQEAVEDVQALAVKIGVARWEVVDSYGKTKFYWNTTNDVTAAEKELDDDKLEAMETYYQETREKTRALNDEVM